MALSTGDGGHVSDPCTKGQLQCVTQCVILCSTLMAQVHVWAG